MLKPIITLKDIAVSFDGEQVLKNFNLTIGDGEFVTLLGPSGCGKTTVGRTILHLYKPTGGEVLYKGREILNLPENEMASLRQREIALIPQGALSSFTPVMTIGRHMREVLELHLGLRGGTAERRITELLEETELPAAVAARYPHELSGGQKQRAAIALALSCEPKLVLADEPTTALDVITQAAILKLLERLRREKNLTILLVTHDLPMAASVCQELFVMKDGELIESGTPRRLIDSPREPHTRALIAAML